MKLKKVKDRLYQYSLPILAISGPIASGKSSALQYLAKYAPTISADQLVTTLYQQKKAITFFKKNYQECIVNNQIDKKILRNKIFTDSLLKKKVEQFVNTHLPSLFLKKCQEIKIKKKKDLSLIIYEVPLLFEQKLNHLVDQIIVIDAPLTHRRQRAQARGITPQLFNKINQQQFNYSSLRKSSKICYIKNKGSIEQLYQKLDQFIKNIFNSLLSVQ